jgi:hypothetical protein
MHVTADHAPEPLSSTAFCEGGIAGNGLQVVEIDFKRDGRYQRFLESQPSAYIFHHPGWLSTLESEYRTKCVVLACRNSNGELEAVLPLMSTLGLPFRTGRQQVGRRLSSLPRTPIAGPLFANRESGIALLQAAVEQVHTTKRQLQLKSQLELPTESVNGLLRTEWRPTYVLEIPQNTKDLRFGDARNRHNVKWGVNKAEKQGLQIRVAETEADLCAWYPLYLQTMRRNFVPPRPLRMFVAMWKNLSQERLMSVQLAEQEQAGKKRLVAGSIFLTFGDTMWYAFTGIGDKDLGLHANDLILWRSIHEACGRGVHWVDFGEVTEDHPELARFKMKWGALPRKQYRYYSDESFGTVSHLSKAGILGRQVVGRVWRRVPLGVTQRLGDWVYRRL